VVIVVLVATLGAGVTGGAGESGTINDGSKDAAAVSAVNTVVENETGSTANILIDGNATNKNRSEEASANATIPPHRLPSDVEDDADPTLLRSRFNRELAVLLVDSAEALRERDYEEAEAAIGPEYDRLLRQYEASGGDATELFNETRLSQEEAIEIAREYQTVRDEYTSALADDDEAAAREAARELQAIAEEANIAAENVSANYEGLDEVTDEDLGEIAQIVEEASDQVLADASEIRESELESTELTINADSETASFDNPVRLNGTLRTADGEPVSNRSIRLRFAANQSTVSEGTTGSGNDTQLPINNGTLNGRTQATATESPTETFESSSVQTTTNTDGNFTVTYRPIQYPLAAKTLIVTFVPEADSVYAGTESSTPLAITEQTQATVAVESASNTTRFDSAVRTNGTVRTAGRPVAGVPIEASIGEWTLGQTATDANGTFSMDGRLPAAVPDGQQELSARIKMSDRTVSTAVDIAPITVAVTDTTIEVETATRSAPEAATDTNETTIEGTPTNKTSETSTNAANGSELEVMGTLRTTTEVGVPAQSITLQVGTATVGIVSTDEDGRFTATLSTSERAALNRGTPLVASFDGKRTNLAGTNTTIVPFPTATDTANTTAADTASSPLSKLTSLAQIDVPVLLAVAALGAGTVGTIWLFRRRVFNRVLDAPSAWLSSLHPGGANGNTQADRLDESETNSDASSVAPAMSAVAMGAPEALAEAESLREEDPSAAIQLTYTTLREAIAERVASDASVTATHREFLASVHDQLPTAEAFATVTDTFEQATFSASEVTAEDAEVVLNHAESILSAQSLRSDGGSEADEHDQ
jgi:hypothetical protein